MQNLSNSVARSAVNTNDIPVQKDFILARLTQVHSFRRGDFKLLDYGITVREVKIESASKKDRLNLPEEGTIFYITNFPADSEGNLLPDDFDGKPNYIQRRSRRMRATLLTQNEDEVDGVEDPPPSDLHQAIKSLVAAFTNPFKGSRSGLPFESCPIRPVNLKDMVNKLKSPSSRRTRIASDNAPPKLNDQGGKVVSGAYMEVSEEGNISISTNNRGLVMDEKGGIMIQGDIVSNQFGMRRPSMGFDSFSNPISDMQPKTIISPMYLGPLAIDRIPDFSLINWAYKLFNMFRVIKNTVSAVKEEKKQDRKREKSKAMQDREKSQSETEGSGKDQQSGIDKFIELLPFNF